MLGSGQFGIDPMIHAVLANVGADVILSKTMPIQNRLERKKEVWEAVQRAITDMELMGGCERIGGTLDVGKETHIEQFRWRLHEEVWRKNYTTGMWRDVFHKFIKLLADTKCSVGSC